MPSPTTSNNQNRQVKRVFSLAKQPPKEAAKHNGIHQLRRVGPGAPRQGRQNQPAAQLAPATGPDGPGAGVHGSEA